MKLTTTLSLLHKANACQPRYKVLLAALGTDYPKDKPINLLTILEHNGLDDALWALRATAENCNKIAYLMAADFAEQVLFVWQNYAPEDKRPELAIKAVRDFANGHITKGELQVAQAAARAAAAAWAQAAAAAWAADAAARAAADAAADAAVRAAADAHKVKQEEIFVLYLQDEV